MLTHTLHLPPALSEIYGGPRPEWLRDILEYLPCLQSLIVSRLPFFDHNAMTALKTTVKYALPANGYNVRLLLAEREPNTTSQGLAEALLHFQELIYLDLSWTTPARDSSVLSCLSQLEHLQVLKLRGIGLRDSHSEFLANAIGTRVRYLDLRNNFLTDMGVRSLLQGCFLPRPQADDASPFLSDPSAHLFRRSDLDEQFIKTLTQPLTGRSWIESLPHVGITHLYLADNHITVEGAASLLASKRLHCLDVGTVNTAKSLNRQTQDLSPSYEKLPGSEKLIPLLGSVAKENLTYIRAHHAIVTAEAPSKDPLSTNVYLPELAGSGPEIELGPNHAAAELSATHEIHELPSEANFIAELEDTPVSRPTESPSLAERVQGLQIYADEPLPELRRGSIFAPEVVEPPQAANNDDEAPEVISPATCSSVQGPYRQRIQELLSKRPKNHSIPRKDRKENKHPYLHPSHVPHLETLVLTDVPSHVPANSPILSSLRRFITACSNEALLASLQAGSDYSLPPGQARLRAEQARSRSLFALRRLVLEITPLSELKRSWKAAGYRSGAFNSSTGDQDLENMWSVAMDDFSFFETECGIPENDQGKYFPMAALNEKVTLMPEDDGPVSSGSYGRDTLLPPSRNNSQRNVCSRNNSLISSPTVGSNYADDGRSQCPVEVPMVDLVAELASFRRTKKAEYEAVLQCDRLHRKSMSRMSPTPSIHTRSRSSTGLLSPSPSLPTVRSRSPSPDPGAAVSAPHLAMAHYVEGYWKGEVKIVKNPAPKGRSGVVDMYGNYFEKGYLYP